jgi:hypothetical protein
MKRQFIVLLSLTFLAALAAPGAQPDVAAKGKGKGNITAGKKGAKDKVAPEDKSQKGGKKGGEKSNTQGKGH